MKKLMLFFPLSRETEGKKVFISLIIYLAVNISADLVCKLLDGIGFYFVVSILALLINIYVYIGIFLLAYSFIVNTKR